MIYSHIIITFYPKKSSQSLKYECNVLYLNMLTYRYNKNITSTNKLKKYTISQENQNVFIGHLSRRNQF